MDDDDPVATDAQIAAPRIDDMQTITLLLAHICQAQLFGVEEFDDPAFERHAYNSVI